MANKLTLATLTVKIIGDAAKYQSEIKKAEKESQKFKKGIQNNINKAAAAGFAVAAAAATKFVVDSTKAFVSFEDRSAEVFTLMPGMSAAAMDSMRQDMIAYGKDVGRTTDEVIPALYQAISAGVPKDNVFDFLETAHDAALGGVTELTTAVDGITSVVNAYGLDVITAAEASDLMFTAVRLGKTTFGELAGSLSNVTPLAAALGVNFGDVTAALAAMTAQGTPTNQAVVQMRGLLQELGNEGTQVSGIFEDAAGVSFAEFIRQGGNLAGALEIIEQQAAETNTPIQNMFGNVRAGLGALQLTGGGMETFVKNLEEMESAAGATGDAAELMGQSVARGIEESQAAWEAAKLAWGEMFATVVAGGAEQNKGIAGTLELMAKATTAGEQYATAINDIGVNAGQAMEWQAAWKREADGWGVSIRDGNRLLLRQAIAIDIIRDGFTGTTDELRALVNQAEKTNGQIERLTPAIEAATSADWRWIDAAGEAVTVTGAIAEATGNLTTAQWSAIEARRIGTSTIYEYSEAQLAQIEAIAEFELAVANAKRELQGYPEALDPAYLVAQRDLFYEEAEAAGFVAEQIGNINYAGSTLEAEYNTAIELEAEQAKQDLEDLHASVGTFSGYWNAVTTTNATETIEPVETLNQELDNYTGAYGRGVWVAELASNADQVRLEEIDPLNLAAGQYVEEDPYVAKFNALTAAAQGDVEELHSAAKSTAGNYTLTFTIRTVGSFPDAPGGQHGLHMIVPPGFPNDSFPIMASSGETVDITPFGATNKETGGATYYIDIDARGAGPGVEAGIRREVEKVMRQYGRHSESIMRRS